MWGLKTFYEINLILKYRKLEEKSASGAPPPLKKMKNSSTINILKTNVKILCLLTYIDLHETKKKEFYQN